jgi:hypothetical protein
VPTLSYGKRSMIGLPEQLPKTPSPECPPILALIGSEIIFQIANLPSAIATKKCRLTEPDESGGDFADSAESQTGPRS